MSIYMYIDVCVCAFSNFTYLLDDPWGREVSVFTVVYGNIDASIVEGLKDSN